MFTWLNKQGVKSERGFSVQFTGRFTAEYREGRNVIAIHVEDGMNGGVPCIIIGPEAFEKWHSVSDGNRISPSRQAEILQNFRDAVEFQGLRLVIERAADEHIPGA